MARKPRIIGASGVYHVILRGNDQQNLFYNDEDRIFFINRVRKYSKELKIQLYAYCLMSNHVHILLGNGNLNMSKFVKKLTCSYVYRFNKIYNRTGHLFQGRYKSEPVDTTEYFKTVYRYILQNPQKANICCFQKYKWSSFSIENSSNLIDLNFLDSVFLSSSSREAFLSSKNDDSCMENIENIKYTNDDDLKILFIMQLFQIDNIFSINECPIDQRNQKIAYLKKCGLSINQISRITRINRYIVSLA